MPAAGWVEEQYRRLGWRGKLHYHLYSFWLRAEMWWVWIKDEPTWHCDDGEDAHLVTYRTQRRLPPDDPRYAYPDDD